MDLVFTQVQNEIIQYLDRNIENIDVREFWSEDGIEARLEFDDNMNITASPAVLTAVASSVQQARHSIPQDTTERLRITHFIGYHNSRDENARFRELENAAFIIQSYMTQKKFGSDYSNQEHTWGWEKTIAYEDDEMAIMELSGNLDLEISLNEIKRQYES